MIPKFRVWDTTDGVMSEVLDIDFVAKVVELKNENMSNYFKPFSEIVFLQSTGFEDINGQKIFEGDIIKSKLGNVFRVRFMNGAIRIKSLRRPYTRTLSKHYLKDSEILGNIYENPELLEVEE